ncbi:MAG: BlaI/MecI/CopY family transcriptional regulator [Pseudomonadota bacterium]
MTKVSKTRTDDKCAPEISKSEYDILRPLWKQSPLSVREVHDQTSVTSGWAYTTTKTTMDRLVAKGMLAREQQHGVFVYRPLISKPAGLAQMIRFFADRVLEMDRVQVVSMMQGNGALSDHEVEELTRLIDDRVDESERC